MRPLSRRTFLASAAALPARQPRAETLALMHRVNNWQLAHPTAKPAEDRDWVRATWYTGVMEAWKATRDCRFLEQALAWGRKNEWQVAAEPTGPNRLFCLQTWLELYFECRERAMIEPAIAWLAAAAPNSPAGSPTWYLDNHKRSYADSLYGAAAFPMLYKATGDRKYLDILHAFFRAVTRDLRDAEDGLFYRDVRFIGQRTRANRKVFWSRGNGWVLAGIPRLLEYLPKDDPVWSEYIALFRSLAAAVAKRQPAGGLWRPNLDDPEDVPLPESSGTGFFVYALAWGIRNNLLPRAEFLPAVRRGWDGLRAIVSPEGQVLWGQQVDGQPNLLKRESTDEYVTGTFLLAASQVYRGGL